jgi:hypothetical protein
VSRNVGVLSRFSVDLTTSIKASRSMVSELEGIYLVNRLCKFLMSASVVQISPVAHS